MVDREDIEAEAVLDEEGWCVIILTNVVGIPVVISEYEPIRLVIVPRRREPCQVCGKFYGKYCRH